MKYEYVLFDADETLFSFDNFSGIKRLLSRYGQTFTEADFLRYQSYNKRLWQRYQDHEIDATFLQVERFVELAAQINISAQQLNDEFLDTMAEICEPLPGAMALLDRLHGKATLGIITNGLARMQHKRITHTGLEGRFSCLVISEETGKPKPHIDIFEHTFELLGQPDKSKILMVGDTLSSDILGGQNAGIDTCWLQHPGIALPTTVHPTYHITHLDQLHDILFTESAGYV